MLLTSEALFCPCWLVFVFAEVDRVEQFAMLTQFEQGRSWGSAHSYCFKSYNLLRMKVIGKALSS